MFGSVSEEIEVKVAAREAWELYGTLKLSRIIQPRLSHLVDKIELLEGDGGIGTLFKITLPPGIPGLGWFKEKFTKIDNDKMIKEVEIVEGDFVDLGFTLYRIRFEVMEKDVDSCITKATIEYQLKEEATANASFVSIQPFLAIMNAAAQYLLNNKTLSC